MGSQCYDAVWLHIKWLAQTNGEMKHYTNTVSLHNIYHNKLNDATTVNATWRMYDASLNEIITRSLPYRDGDNHYKNLYISKIFKIFHQERHIKKCHIKQNVVKCRGQACCG